MTPHERCRAAIAMEPVDRPPRYLPGIACEVASRILGRQAYGGTGSLHYAEACAWDAGETAHEDFQEQLYQDLTELCRVLAIDVFRMPWRMRQRPTRRLDELTFLYGDPEGRHAVYRYSPDSGDFGEIASADPGQADLAAFEREVAEQERAFREGALEAITLDDQQERLCRELGGEFFVAYCGGGIGVGLSAERLMLLALAPDVMRRDLMNQARAAVAVGRKLAATPYPHVLVGGLDLAGNDGPMYSPAAFRDAMLPACTYLTEQLRPLGVHYVFRSDGKLWAVSDMLFAEAGIDGYGEVDREVGMTVAAVRRRYPKLVLWGNFSSSFLVRASAAEVRDEAGRIEDETSGTGYFHGCSNAILRGTPTENVHALFPV